MIQTTIQKAIECTGIGLHSGKTVKLGLRPAAEYTGIVFHVRTPKGVKTISPAPEVVVATGLATTLGKEDVRVSTVEHLLAAIRGLGIDNIHVDVDGGEIPIMDGSAATFVLLLKGAGVIRQSAPRQVWRIKSPLTLSRDGKYIEAYPHDGFQVDCTISFSHQLIGTQRFSLDVTPESFAAVAKARTFGFLRDVEMMRSRGLALGGSLDNAVVLDDCGVVNTDGLRFADEFVRHKVLDFIGDMAMLSLPLQGRFVVSCSGHALNNEFLRTAFANQDVYLEKVTLRGPQQARQAARQSAPTRTRATEPVLAV